MALAIPGNLQSSNRMFWLFYNSLPGVTKKSSRTAMVEKQVYGLLDGGRMVGPTVVLCVLVLQINWSGVLFRFAANIVLLQRVDQQHSSMSDV